MVNFNKIAKQIYFLIDTQDRISGGYAFLINMLLLNVYMHRRLYVYICVNVSYA